MKTQTNEENKKGCGKIIKVINKEYLKGIYKKCGFSNGWILKNNKLIRDKVFYCEKCLKKDIDIRG